MELDNLGKEDFNNFSDAFWRLQVSPEKMLRKNLAGNTFLLVMEKKTKHFFIMSVFGQSDHITSKFGSKKCSLSVMIILHSDTSKTKVVI